MEVRRNTFPKEEHLYGQTAVDMLFRKGKSFLAFPVKVTYLVTTDELPVRCMVVAPKKKFKHAVDRNRVKRQLREAYRKNKFGLQDWAVSHEQQLHFSMVYVGDRLMPSNVVERKIKVALEKLLEKLG
ncbi:MAG: ribonuclease P protein component [Paludibacteraceae bacterium]|nr:ribonuclease P protein component [Paludibacteraceae bacterium]